jgi:hypothetical protein
MSIDYNTIMTSSSEDVEEYISRNHFTDKQKLRFTVFITETEDKITVNVKKNEVPIFDRNSLCSCFS